MREEFFIVLTMAGLAVGFLYLVRTLLRHRQRSRWVKLQAEIHNKIIDKLNAGDELLQYLSSGGGPVFAPQVEEDARPRPLGRILGSLQAGIVLALGGGALIAIRNQTEGPDLFVLGTLGLALGIGFLLSGLVSFYLSRSWGLLDTPPASGADGHPS